MGQNARLSESGNLLHKRPRTALPATLKGYEPCQDQETIAEEIGYDSERDLDNPTGSVFCAHGAGFVVPWYEVEEYMHLEGTEIQEWDDVYDDSEEGVGNGAGSASAGQGEVLTVRFLGLEINPVENTLPCTAAMRKKKS